MIRRLTLLVALGAGATIMGLLAAPQLVLLVARLAPADGPPSLSLTALALVGYEIGLWGAGLALWLIAQRVGWLSGPAFAVALVVSPVAGEIGYWRLLGDASASPGLASPMGLIARLAVGACAVLVALWSVRARSRAPEMGSGCPT